MHKIIFVFLVFVTLNSYAQKGIKRFKLSKELTEISGLEKFNDSILIAINDGGNSPEIYFLDLSGNILKKTFIKNAYNRDWEDLTMDDKRNLYIADVGNNLGSFEEFYLLKLNVDEAYKNDTVSFNKLTFSYPLKDGERSPDCEAIYWFQDSLHLITKNNTKLKHEGSKSENQTVSALCPKHYRLSDDKPYQTAIECDQNIPFLQRVRNKGIRDLVTAVDVKEGVGMTRTKARASATRCAHARPKRPADCPASVSSPNNCRRPMTSSPTSSTA